MFKENGWANWTAQNAVLFVYDISFEALKTSQTHFATAHVGWQDYKCESNAEEKESEWAHINMCVSSKYYHMHFTMGDKFYLW